MKSASSIYRTEKIRRWINDRDGRIQLLAQRLEMPRRELGRLINENRINPELLNLLEEKQLEILGEEKVCLRKFGYFLRFAQKGEGRIPLLARETGIHAHLLRSLVKAKGDSRYRMIAFGMEKIMSGMREVNKCRSLYRVNNVGIRMFLTRDMKRKCLTFSEIQELAQKVKENADYGNHGAAVVFHAVTRGKFRIIAVGFDSYMDELCKSHICDLASPHLHAVTMAMLNLRKESEGIALPELFTHNAPDFKCAELVIQKGISKVYCYFEPDEPTGLELLRKHGIPVEKINVTTGKLTLINQAQESEVA